MTQTKSSLENKRQIQLNQRKFIQNPGEQSADGLMEIGQGSQFFV
jgi:hypothetical protein